MIDSDQGALGDAYGDTQKHTSRVGDLIIQTIQDILSEKHPSPPRGQGNIGKMRRYMFNRKTIAEMVASKVLEDNPDIEETYDKEDLVIWATYILRKEVPGIKD